MWRAALVCSTLAACGLFPDVGGLAADGGEDVTVSDAGTDASDGAAPDAADAGANEAGEAGASCPDGGGPAMVDVGPFCIDSTEVSVDQYQSFLGSSPSLTLLPPECAFKSSYTTTSISDGTLPVDDVDWCDAYAFCRWAGKRLCGSIGGGPSDFAAYPTTTNQWYYACSANGTRAYPYGDNYDGALCNDVDYGVGSTVPVASDGCVGSVAGLHDMAGNVWEWEDSCSGDAGAGDLCRVRGGCWVDSSTQTACAFDSFQHFTTTRGGPQGYVGFRCCGP